MPPAQREEAQQKFVLRVLKDQPADLHNYMRSKLIATTSKDLPHLTDPSYGMGGAERAAAAFGKGMSDVAQGLGQAVGLQSTQDVAETRKRDEPLMARSGTTIPAMLGSMAPAALTALLPGAGTLAGSIAIGAGSGYLAPYADNEEQLTNAGLGAVIPGALGAAARIPQLARSLAMPFVAPSAAALKIVEREAGVPLDTLQSRVRPQGPLAGSQQSLAEALPGKEGASVDRELAILQRGARSLSGAYPADIEAARNAVRLAPIRKIARGDDIAESTRWIDNMDQRRKAAVRPMYSAVDNDSNVADVTGLKSRLDEMITKFGPRPDVAAPLVKLRGSLDQITGGGSATSVGQLHIYYQGVKDALEKREGVGLANQAAFGQLNALKSELQQTLKAASPAFAKAEKESIKYHRQIDKAKVGRELLQRSTSGLEASGGNPVLHAEAFAKAVRNRSKLEATATGFRRAKSLLSADQHKALDDIAADLSRHKEALTAGAVPGQSNTAQMLASQNKLMEHFGLLAGAGGAVAGAIFGGLELGAAGAAGAAAGAAGAGAKHLKDWAQRRVNDTLSRYLHDPTAFVEAAKKEVATRQRLGAFAQHTQRVAGAISPAAIAAYQAHTRERKYCECSL